MQRRHAPLDIAVIGTGIAGMSAAWLLSHAHRVTVFEQSDRLGGHSNTVEVPTPDGPVPVDIGFIVYNEAAYPNLTALFRHLGVATAPSDMSFAVSLREGALEYAATDLRGLFAQRRNLVRPRFWRMLFDLLRFYREAPRVLATIDGDALTLREWLDTNGYGRAFVEDHLLPMAAAIWSTPANAVGDQPAANFIRFCHNHGLLRLKDRPVWRTVAGGSRRYIERLTAPYAEDVRLCCGVRALWRFPDGVLVADDCGGRRLYDHVVIATHPDQALAMLPDRSDAEADLLGAFRYRLNNAYLHTDAALMPRRRAAWSSWNYLGGDAAQGPSVTYWMNRLQGLQTPRPLFVSLNPQRTARSRRRAAHRALFPSATRRRGGRRTEKTVVAAGRSPHLVLRRLVRRRLSRGRAAIRPRGRRAAWRRPPAMARAQRIRPHPHHRPRAGNGGGMTNSAIYHGNVVHSRFRPVRHRLRHRMFWLLLDLDELPSLARRLRLFSLNRFNLVDFHDRDHGDGSRAPLRAQLEKLLRDAGLQPDGGAIRVLCMPRVLGTVFNPLSVFFCYRSDGCLQAMLYEVHNTFGERHSYLIPVSDTDAQQPVLRQSCAKEFHVSPFMDMAMTYSFHVTPPAEGAVVAVDGNDANGRLISAVYSGTRRALTDANLVRAFITQPLLAAQVLGAIHWEALKLWRKGVRPRAKPQPPAELVSVVKLP